jgi:hypothetical protein
MKEQRATHPTGMQTVLSSDGETSVAVVLIPQRRGDGSCGAVRLGLGLAADEITALDDALDHAGLGQ